MGERETACAAVSLASGEQLHGTAPRASAWLLVEQPGAWGRKALTESELDLELGVELERRAKAAGAKVLLVKRPGRAQIGRRRRAFVCSPAPDAAYVEELELDDLGTLLEIDLTAVAHGQRTELGRIRPEPLYLVCTNGRRDACCARLGRPVLRALAETRPGAVWECSHLGGHRFAANVVCLPAGICYGRVTVADAHALPDRYDRGELDVPRLRGRASLAPVEQAAEAYLRLREEIAAVDGLSLVDSANGTSTFTTLDGRRFQVDIASSQGPPRPASCGDPPEPSERFELLALEQLD